MKVRYTTNRNQAQASVYFNRVVVAMKMLGLLANFGESAVKDVERRWCEFLEKATPLAYDGEMIEETLREDIRRWT